MITAKLVLGEYFGNLPGIEIDIATFNFYGHITEYHNGKEDASISFRLANSEDSESVVKQLRAALRLNVDKTEYIKLRTEFQSYESDKRPRITIRLCSGMRGLANPSWFSFNE